MGVIILCIGKVLYETFFFRFDIREHDKKDLTIIYLDTTNNIVFLYIYRIETLSDKIQIAIFCYEKLELESLSFNFENICKYKYSIQHSF